MILILGSNGQLGTDLINSLKNSNVDHISLTRNDIDINKLDSLYDILMQYEFTSLINCTGYHKTDEVEDNADQAFKTNAFAVKTMIKACKDKGIEVFLMQIRILTNYGKRYQTKFESVYAQASRDSGVILVPFMLEEIALEKDMMFSDGIHPNEKAQPLIANFVYENLKLFLK